MQMMALEAVSAIPGAAVDFAQWQASYRRQLGREQRQAAFQNAAFQDTQSTYTMRQAGMAIAERSRYNTQQAMLGREASYIKTIGETLLGSFSHLGYKASTQEGMVNKINNAMKNFSSKEQEQFLDYAQAKISAGRAGGQHNASNALEQRFESEIMGISSNNSRGLGDILYRDGRDIDISGYKQGLKEQRDLRLSELREKFKGRQVAEVDHRTQSQIERQNKHETRMAEQRQRSQDKEAEAITNAYNEGLGSTFLGFGGNTEEATRQARKVARNYRSNVEQTRLQRKAQEHGASAEAVKAAEAEKAGGTTTEATRSAATQVPTAEGGGTTGGLSFDNYSRDAQAAIIKEQGKNYWGRSAQERFHLDSMDRRYSEINKMKAGEERNAAIERFNQDLQSGPGFNDYMNGNQVYGKAAGVGVAALTASAVMGDGRRSNAQLYSSPF